MQCRAGTLYTARIWRSPLHAGEDCESLQLHNRDMMGAIKPVRFKRLRFGLAGAASIVFAWYCFHGLAWLAQSVGIIPVVHYEPAVSQWLLIGDPILQNWHKVRVTEDFTLAGYALVSLTAMLAYYMARLAYSLDFARVFQRRDRWLIAGWIIGTPLIAAEGHLLLRLLSEFPLARRWPTFFGTTALVVFLVSANLFGDLWGWVMRKRRVFPKLPST
jgi:hypothetical protein